MAGINTSLGRFRTMRAACGVSGMLALVGCHSADKEETFGSLDLKTRQMLLAPSGGNNLKAPAQQYAMTDPAVTGASGMNTNNAFNRPMPGQGQSMAKAEGNTTGYVPANATNPNGVVQAAVNAPTIPHNPAVMQLQPRVQQAVATAPVAPPPLAPAAVPATPPVTPMIAVATDPAPIAVVNTAPTPAEFTPPPAPTPSLVAPPALPNPATTGMTTLASPLEQPPAALGPIPPGPLK